MKNLDKPKTSVKKFQIKIESISLEKEGNNTVVYIEFKGERYKVISELSENNFCHTITAYGMAEVIIND